MDANARKPAQQETQAQPKPFMTNGEIVISTITFVYVFISFFTFRVIKQQTMIAQKNVDILLNSERSWVMVDIEWQQGAHIFEGTSSDGSKNTGIYINYVCRNIGRTFAQITSKGYVFKIFNENPPATPDFSNIEWFQFTSKYLRPADAEEDAYHLSGIFCDGTHERGKMSLMFLYGRVDYRDIYGDHQTTFGYLITPKGDLERLPHDTWPEYNQHT